jgi:hypothetical protein
MFDNTPNHLVEVSEGSAVDPTQKLFCNCFRDCSVDFKHRYSFIPVAILGKRGVLVLDFIADIACFIDSGPCDWSYDDYVMYASLLTSLSDGTPFRDSSRLITQVILPEGEFSRLSGYCHVCRSIYCSCPRSSRYHCEGWDLIPYKFIPFDLSRPETYPIGDPSKKG